MLLFFIAVITPISMLRTSLCRLDAPVQIQGRMTRLHRPAGMFGGFGVLGHILACCWGFQPCGLRRLCLLRPVPKAIHSCIASPLPNFASDCFAYGSCYTYTTCLPIIHSSWLISRTFSLARMQSSASYAHTCTWFTSLVLQFYRCGYELF